MPPALELAALPELPDVSADDEEAAIWRERILDRLEHLEPPTVLEGDEDTQLRAALDLVLSSARGRALAVHVRDLDSGRVLYDHRGSEPLVPASNQKLLTATAALELLGPDYRFQTRVYRHEDALYLVGEGDPGLMEDHLYALASQTVVAGELDGIRRIVVDDSAFGSRFFGPGYDPEGAGPAYMAPSGALSMTFNTVELRVRPGKVGSPAHVSAVPESTHVQLRNDTHTGSGRALQAVSSRAGEHTLLEVSGSIRGGHRPVSIRRRITDPGLYTGGAFATVLAHQAQDTPLSVERGALPQDASLVAVHDSAPLVDILDSAMKYSNNFTSEQVLRTLGWRASGQGTWEAGTAVVERFWAGIGHDADAVRVVNGSGLTRRGRATAHALVDVLALSHRPGSGASTLPASMAQSGGPGTLRNRLPFAGAHLRAKTGTLAGVTALSGVVTSKDGQHTWGFSILVNGGRADANRRVQDRMVAAMLRHLG
jgi:D-alanyl-D-alanine carboxypeptidase/D-alanyl-D-alanine-endopeptidase (penicillin-binding protein 4)